MIGILSHVVEFRNSESGEHIIHIRMITELLLRCLVQKTDQYHLSESDIAIITTASALHDIGKIGINEEILNKQGKMTPEEFELMKSHTTNGVEILKNIDEIWEEDYRNVSYDVCYYHHERYDGKGYPKGLKGEEISLSAQLVAIADVYEALISPRIYKESFPYEEAYDMIQEAFAYSERYHTPVLFRPTTRVCHGYASITVMPRGLKKFQWHFSRGGVHS